MLAETTVSDRSGTVLAMLWNKDIAGAYLAHRIKKELGPSPAYGEVAALANAVGVLPQTVSQLRKAARKGTSTETFDKFGKYWGRTHDEFLEDAYAWARENPDAVRLTERKTKRPDRYATFEPTVAFFRARHAGADPGLLSRAIDLVRAAHKGDEDPGPDHWLGELEAELRLLRRQDRDPVGAARKAAERTKQAATDLARTQREADEMGEAFERMVKRPKKR